MSQLPYSVALVTGASSGIGAACVRRLASAGLRAILVARREDRLRTLAAELSVPTLILPMDVREREEVYDKLGSLPPAFAEVDVLVNAAGLALGLEPSHQAAPDAWDTMIDTNVRGLVHVTRALLPGMVERQRGHIFNLGSVAGSYSYPGGNVYGATKAFVERFSMNLRSDLLGTPLRVTNIEPGMVETEFSEVRYGGDQEAARKIYRGMVPMTAEDIAEAVSFCLACPPRVNVNRMELMATAQAIGPFAVHRLEGRG